MDDRMPVLEVCHNREAHKDTKTLYAALVKEFVRHDHAGSVMIRHVLCPACRGEMEADIDELAHITQADN